MKIDSSELTGLYATKATKVALLPYAYVDPQKMRVVTDYDNQWWGERPGEIRQYTKWLKGAGYQVWIKPHLWAGWNTFTGRLEFDGMMDCYSFYKTYWDYIARFADIAERQNADWLVIGTELQSFWQYCPTQLEQIIDSVKKRYTGNITYAANWDEFSEFPYWQKMDAIGVDAYFPVKSKSIENHWRMLLDSLQRFSQRHQKPLVLTELGYRSVESPHRKPWSSGKNKAVNEQAQYKAWQAFLKAIEHRGFPASYFVWKYHVDPHIPERPNKAYTPQNKKAEQLFLQESKGF